MRNELPHLGCWLWVIENAIKQVAVYRQATRFIDDGRSLCYSRLSDEGRDCHGPCTRRVADLSTSRRVQPTEQDGDGRPFFDGSKHGRDAEEYSRGGFTHRCRLPSSSPSWFRRRWGRLEQRPEDRLWFQGDVYGFVQIAFGRHAGCSSRTASS